MLFPCGNKECEDNELKLNKFKKIIMNNMKLTDITKTNRDDKSPYT